MERSELKDFHFERQALGQIILVIKADIDDRGVQRKFEERIYLDKYDIFSILKQTSNFTRKQK